jgi:hypothetical protein
LCGPDNHAETTGSSSRDDERTVFRLLVPTLACRKFMITGRRILVVAG